MCNTIYFLQAVGVAINVYNVVAENRDGCDNGFFAAAILLLFAVNLFMNNTYTIRIKKEYASAIIEDLKQVDAIEIL